MRNKLKYTAVAAVLFLTALLSTVVGAQTQSLSLQSPVQYQIPYVGTSGRGLLVQSANLSYNPAIGLTALGAKVGSSGQAVSTATYAPVATDEMIYTTFAGTVTVTLPAASASTGRRFTIMTTTANTVISASSNVYPLGSSSAGTAILAATIGKWADLISDGTAWRIWRAN